MVDEDIAADLVERADLTRAQAVALAPRIEQSIVRLVARGLLMADDIDPVARPDAALAVLADGGGYAAWARWLAADPSVGRRERLATCPGLPGDVRELLAADGDLRVVAELALWTTPDTAALLAEHPHAEVRCAVAGNEATPPQVLAALITAEGVDPARSCLVCDRVATPFAHDPHCPEPDCDLPPGASCDGSHESTVHETQLRALRNPATPTAAVIGFADHPSMLLRQQLAARPDLPPATYEHLAGAPEPGVRATLAQNPAIGDRLIGEWPPTPATTSNAASRTIPGCRWR
ncbi:hypothetical protein GCM10010411_66420 [Actinomadura fulvescens]|uniref:Leucine rich repeat variant n=2 Tax=Actinomadura fulvescens TaxID=46160 RepID=A0ABN3QAR3_9ACTN